MRDDNSPYNLVNNTHFNRQKNRPKRSMRLGIPKAKSRNPKDDLKIGFMNAQSAMYKALAMA